MPGVLTGVWTPGSLVYMPETSTPEMTAPNAELIGSVEKVTRGTLTYWNVRISNRCGYGRVITNTPTEADAIRVATAHLAKEEAVAIREIADREVLDYIDGRCDQCGTRLPASRRCHSCEL